MRAALFPLLAALAVPAAAAERSLLFTAAERQRLACVLAPAQADGPGPGYPMLPVAAGPAPVAHLSALVYAGAGEWEFRLNGQVGRPGRLPTDILSVEVTPDTVTLVRLDPTDGSRRSLRLRVGERRPWFPRAAAVPSSEVIQDKQGGEVLPSAECPPTPAREARP